MAALVARALYNLADCVAVGTLPAVLFATAMGWV